MTQAITEQTIKALSNVELLQVEEFIRTEQRDRAELHKRQTLAKIKELAKSIDVAVKVRVTREGTVKSSLAKMPRQLCDVKPKATTQNTNPNV
jgi:hypothetical protein